VVFTAFDYDADGGAEGRNWAVSELLAVLVRDFKGSAVVITADCCYSGAVVEQVRGACSVCSDAVRLKVRRLCDRGAPPPFSVCCVTSATMHQVSSAGWTFSDSLLDALDG
jgi:hypothetical protein